MRDDQRVGALVIACAQRWGGYVKAMREGIAALNQQALRQTATQFDHTGVIVGVTTIAQERHGPLQTRISQEEVDRQGRLRSIGEACGIAIETGSEADRVGDIQRQRVDEGATGEIGRGVFGFVIWVYIPAEVGQYDWQRRGAGTRPEVAKIILAALGCLPRQTAFRLNVSLQVCLRQFEFVEELVLDDVNFIDVEA